MGALLQDELRAAEERYEHSKSYYVNARRNLTKQRSVAKEALELVEKYEVEGEMKMAEEQEEKAAAYSSQANKIEETVLRAKEVAQADYARIEELKGFLSHPKSVLPQSEVETLAKSTCVKEARKAVVAKGINPASPKGKKFEAAFIKKALPSMIKHYSELNKVGNLNY